MIHQLAESTEFGAATESLQQLVKRCPREELERLLLASIQSKTLPTHQDLESATAPHLDRLDENILSEIVSGLAVCELVQFGSTSHELRAMLKKEIMWAPRLSTVETGLGNNGLEPSACAALSELGCDPRSLVLQSWCWTVNGSWGFCQSRRGAFYHADWDLLEHPPVGLSLIAAEDFVFCDVCVGRTHWQRVVRLADCSLNDSGEVIIPLNVDFTGFAEYDPSSSKLAADYWNLSVRVFTVVDGILAPIADTLVYYGNYSHSLGTHELDGGRRDCFLNWRMRTAEYVSENCLQETVTFVGNSDMLRSIKISLVVRKDVARILNKHPEHRQSIQGREDCIVSPAEGQHFVPEEAEEYKVGDSRFFIQQGHLCPGSVQEFFRLLVAFALDPFDGRDLDREISPCPKCGSQQQRDHNSAEGGPSLECLHCNDYSTKDLVEALCHRITLRTTPRPVSRGLEEHNELEVEAQLKERLLRVLDIYEVA